MTSLNRFHAHVYFDRAQRVAAIDLRREIGRLFALPVGAVFDRPVGPHSKGTFQVVFQLEDFGRLVPWLMQHRGDLDVLVHGDTGDDLVDHTQYVIWLGTPQDLDTDMFRSAAPECAVPSTEVSRPGSRESRPGW